MFSRRVRIFFLGAVITLGLLGVLLIQSPEPTRSVDEVMITPSKYVDKEIALRGEVLDGSIDSNASVFILHGDDSTLVIDYIDASVSNGLGDNRTVYAQGVLRYIDGEYIFEADIIKTSCPSKYEEEATIPETN
ncbi:MAG: cytochrome c maturation protein CcmE [Candidatus Poseidoniaceae archaeon]|nr:cytochrome c maturation protein CcmE [Candidatus Poseidoniaceae archaeon]